MKRTFSLLLCILLLTGLCVPAMAETAQETAALPEWLELSADDTVLTVRLPLEDAKEQSWRFSISNPSILDLLTCEVVGDEPGETGEGMWVGSFMGTFRKAGAVSLQLTLTGSDGAHLETRRIHLFVNEANYIEVVSAEENSWYFLDEEQLTLTVALPANPSTGFIWMPIISNEEILGYHSETFISDAPDLPISGAGGTWIAKFTSQGKPGTAELKLHYARPWESRLPQEMRALQMVVDESGRILITGEEYPAPEGRYFDPFDGEDATVLLIEKTEDGRYSVDLSIFRLTSQEDGAATYENGVLTMTAADAAGNPMVWEISRSPVGLTARVVKSAWALLPEGTEYEFIPAE